MEMNGGSSALHLARTPCVPGFCTLFNRDGNRRASRLPGEGADHFHCTVEPSRSYSVLIGVVSPHLLVVMTLPLVFGA